MSLEERVRYTILGWGKAIGGDWTTLCFIGAAATGFFVAILDFVFLQDLTFQVYSLAGLFIYIVGSYFRIKARFELKRKAGFGGLATTAGLQIVQNHRLVSDGLYKHIRHPIYLGEILRGFGFVIILSSIYGALFIAVSAVFLLFRIRIEEQMLIEAFGDEYREYQRKTKRLIPYIY